MFNKSIKSYKRHRALNRTLSMIFAILLYAITFNLFLRPNNIVIGGMGGLSLIIQNFIDVNVSLIVIVLSLFFTLMGMIFLEKKTIIQTLLAAVCYPLFIYLTYDLGSYIKIDQNEMLVIILFAGILLGTSDGIVEKTGFFTGGTDILSKLIVKKTRIKPSTAIVMVEGFILLGGLIVYGNEQLIYAIVILYVLSLVSSKIMLNISKRKIFYIYTDDVEDVKKYIHYSLGYDVTIIQNRCIGRHQSILMSIVNTSDYYALREGVEEIDPHAKIIIFDSYEHYERRGKDIEKELLKEVDYELI